MTILFFTTISPFPQNGGEKIRSYYLLKVLSQLGYKVLAVIRNIENVDLSVYEMENVTFYTHPETPLSVVERATGNHYFKRSRYVLQLFKQICMQHPVSLAILDYGYVGHYIDFFAAKDIPVVLGTHNAQPMISWQVPAGSLLQKLRKYQLVALEKLHERRYFKKAAVVLVVSENDRQYHSTFISPEKMFVIPNFLDETEYAGIAERDANVLVMTANFGQYMNYQGLKWFVENVWDDTLAERYELRLVGKKSKEALVMLTGKEHWNNISALGKVDDVKQYIAAANCVIIPLLHGSGTRLKCLEAMALRTPVISTAKGVEGVDSNHFIIADTASAFKKAILEFNGGTQLGEGLWEDFMKEYSVDINRQRMQQAVNYALQAKQEIK